MLDKPAIRSFVATAHKRSLAPKHTLLHAGDQPDALHLMLEGSVSVTLADGDGREMVLTYLGPGEFFGESCLFADARHPNMIVRTRGPTLLAEMGRRALHSFIDSHPDFLIELAGQLAQRLQCVNQRLAQLTFLDVTGRLAQTLLDLGRKPDALPHPSGVIVRISRTELARHIGCSREMAGRALKKLRHDGLVEDYGRGILIFGGPEALARRAA